MTYPASTRMEIAKALALDQLSALAAMQRTIADDMLGAARHANEVGVSWRKIGRELGMPYETVFRQVKAGSPVSVVRPHQRPKAASGEASERAPGSGDDRLTDQRGVSSGAVGSAGTPGGGS
jgi:hypothetical protein